MTVTLWSSALTLLGLAVFTASRPLEAAESVIELRLRWAGVTSHYYNRMRTLESNRCANSDECRCVLFIHGLGDQALTWRHILAQAPQFENVRFVAVDLPGSGRSAPLNDERHYRVTELAEQLHREVIPSCPRWSIVGNSFGGWVAINLALNHPEATKSLLLVGTAGLKGDYSHIYPLFLEPSRERVKEYERLTYHRPKSWLPDRVYDSLAERLSRAPIVSILKAQTETDFIDGRLGELRVPVRLVWGASDRIIPPAFGTRFASAAPGAVLDVREGCGHLPQVECPEALLSHLSELL